jgi:hypothetical protein
MRSPYPNSQAAARRNPFLRVERLLTAIEKAGREPHRWEVHHFLNALGLMTIGDFYEGEHAMMLAEREPSGRGGITAAVDASTEIASVKQLRERLRKAQTGEIDASYVEGFF